MPALELEVVQDDRDRPRRACTQEDGKRKKKKDT
jgi:hypothetical protein